MTFSSEMTYGNHLDKYNRCLLSVLAGGGRGAQQNAAAWLACPAEKYFPTVLEEAGRLRSRCGGFGWPPARWASGG